MKNSATDCAMRSITFVLFRCKMKHILAWGIAPFEGLPRL